MQQKECSTRNVQRVQAKNLYLSVAAGVSGQAEAVEYAAAAMKQVAPPVSEEEEVRCVGVVVESTAVAADWHPRGVVYPCL